jgi:proteasome lid subunit RPN8/RPN11
MTQSHAKAFEDAKAHARSVYPSESCGLIVGDAYIACENKASDPAKHVADEKCACQLCAFVISSDVIVKHHGKIQVVVHSHPNGPLFPSTMDAKQQIASGLVWAMIPLDEDRMGEPVIWGGATPIAPIIGREFVHYTADCYTLIRDCFRLGAEALVEHNVMDWPYQATPLPEFPRDDAWWDKSDDFYQTEPTKIGFREIAREEALPGDVFLLSIRAEKLNHGGLLIGDGLILHHLPNRLSRREPANLWVRQAKRWLRWTGADQ